LPYYVRLMRREDVPQIAEIDREAFPTQWPPPNYRREMENRLAHYVVICDESKKARDSETEAVPETGLSTRVKHLFTRLIGDDVSNPSKDFIVGFAGMWIMADEAHVTNIAVREHYRRRGLGESLFISIIELALELKANFITLEVRTSNAAAQSLYRKYGFNKVGTRRGYYIDNGEDALLMTTENITTADFQAKFQKLKQAHFKKRGVLYRLLRDAGLSAKSDRARD
jgi:ribosomal-protein-alanine N-acetyltransferase